MAVKPCKIKKCYLRKTFIPQPVKPEFINNKKELSSDALQIITFQFSKK